MKIRTKLVRIASQEHSYNTANGNARLYEPFDRRPDSRSSFVPERLEHEPSVSEIARIYSTPSALNTASSALP